MSSPATQPSISLSLVSHTNAGKTTLARTLLGRDIGEVRDAPHVTEFADVFTMLETSAGERLLLWDTPGFGDSGRLVKRLRAAGKPIGWLMSEVWDRWRDRPFWSTQQAMKNVRDEADVMLYLVSAAESPEAAGYVQPEMELLGWIDKPVVVLLNQLGMPRQPALEGAEVERWRRHLSAHAHVKAVLPLDAFARCWVQEVHLLGAIEDALSDGQRALMSRLRGAWQQERLKTFDGSMQALADSLARTAQSHQTIAESGGLRGRWHQARTALRLGDSNNTPAARAQRSLAEAFDAELRSSTSRLIALHGLEGKATGEVLKRLATNYETRAKVGEGTAALWGGVVSGALVGLKADVLSGGLTLGGGMLAGGLLGALGGAGLARGVNLVRGTDSSWLAWSPAALDAMVEAALLRYLAVAHFGRGRGDWAASEAPAHWAQVVSEAVAPLRESLAVLWAGRDVRHVDAEEQGRLAASLAEILGDAAASALRRLYPGCAESLQKAD